MLLQEIIGRNDMEFMEFNLCESIYSAIDLEIKYYVASARAENCPFICLNLQMNKEDSNYGKRLNNTVKTLRALKKNKSIQFFVREDDLDKNTTEVQFILNKYNDHIKIQENRHAIYIKL